MKILVLTKRQYMNKDLIDDRFGRFREIPLALAQKGHKVQGLCLSYSDKKEGLFQDELVAWHSINATFMKLPGLLRFIRTARSYAMKADIIWACSDSIYGIIGHLLSTKLGIPLVFDLYDNFEYFLMARLPGIKQFYRYVVKNCDAVTCVSRPLAGLVASYGRDKPIFVLENAVRKDLFMPMSKEECRKVLNLPQHIRIIGTAGALTKNRGIKVLFEAFDIFRKKNENIHLAVAGPRNLTIPKDIKIHDLGILPLEKVPILLNSLDVGVICNQKNEFGKYCFPQKTREMMACSIPIVAAKIGSMEELFVDRPEWLYEPGDCKSLTKALEFRLLNPQAKYEIPTDWTDLAAILEEIMLKVSYEEK